MLLRYRFKKVSCAPNEWKPDKVIIKHTNLAITAAIIYALLILFIDSFFDLQSYNAHNVCVHRENVEKPPSMLVVQLTTALPRLTFQLATIVLDVLCFYDVQKQKSTGQKSKIRKQIQEKHTSILAEIPFRASLISSFILFLQIIVQILIGMEWIQPMEKYALVFICVRATSIWRNPLIATCAFRVNEENRKRNAEEERIKRRNSEIQDALKRREARKKNLPGNNA